MVPNENGRQCVQQRNLKVRVDVARQTTFYTCSVRSV